MKSHKLGFISFQFTWGARVIFTVFLLTTPMLINATETAESKPSDLVKSAVNEITAELRANSDRYKDSPKQLQAMVEQQASTYFNFQRMTQIAAAKYWRDASDAQKTALIHEFKTQLIRSYAYTLFNYRNATAEIISEELNDKGRVMVKLRVRNERGEPTLLFLLMEKSQQRWQIIDVNVEGVSIVITARSRFSEEITNKGLDGLIESLRAENQRLAP